MNRIAPTPALLLAWVVASADVAAQTVDLPVGGSGGEAETYPFGVPSSRVQSVFTGLVGTAGVFGELRMRRSGTLPNAPPIGGYNPGLARTFQSLEIELGDGDAGTFGEDLAVNRLGSMTAVFRQGVSLPDATAWPSNPMPWAQSYSFPFSQPYIYAGTRDLLVDLRVDGGALAGNAYWGTYSSYVMDGWRRRTDAVAWTDFYFQPGCNLQLQIGGRVDSFPNGMRAQAYIGAVIQPNLPVVVGLGLTGVRDPSAGLPIAGSCHPLMMQPLWYLLQRTNATGRFDAYLYQGAPIPGLVGLPIFGQAAYTDPGTTAFQLTNAVELRMPDVPDLTVRARTKYAVPASSNRAQQILFSDARGPRIQLR